LLWWFKDRLSLVAGVQPDRITLDSSFLDDLGADSLDQVELVMELEEEFDMAVPPDDLNRIRTVADAIRYIEERRARGDAA
jgi:acyl carrier protein